MTLFFLVNSEQILEGYEETEAYSILPFMLNEIKNGNNKSAWYQDIMHFIYSKNIRLKPLVYKFINCYYLPIYLDTIQNAVCTDLKSDNKKLVIAALEFLKDAKCIFESCVEHIINLVNHDELIVRKSAYLAFEKLFMAKYVKTDYDRFLVLNNIKGFDEYEYLKIIYKVHVNYNIDREDIYKILLSSTKIEIKLICLLILYKEAAKLLYTYKLEKDMSNITIDSEIEKKKHINYCDLHNFKSLENILNIADLVHYDSNFNLQKHKETFKNTYDELRKNFYDLHTFDGFFDIMITCRIFLALNDEILNLLSKVILFFQRNNAQITLKLFKYIREVINSITIIEKKHNVFIICLDDDFYAYRSKMNFCLTLSLIRDQTKIEEKNKYEELEYICMFMCCKKKFLLNDIFEYYRITNIFFQKLFIKSLEYFNQIDILDVHYKSEKEKICNDFVNNYLKDIKFNYITINDTQKKKFIAQNSSNFHWLSRIRGIPLNIFMNLFFKNEEIDCFLLLIEEEKIKNQELCTSFPLNKYTEMGIDYICDICCKKCQLKDAEKKKMQKKIIANYNIDDIVANVVVIQKKIYLDVISIKKTTRYRIANFSSFIEKPGLIQLYEFSNSFFYNYFYVRIANYYKNLRIDLFYLIIYPRCTLSEFITGFNFLTNTETFDARPNLVLENLTFKKFIFFMAFDFVFFGVHKDEKIILRSNNGEMLNNMHIIWKFDDFINENENFSVFQELKTNKIFQKFMEYSLIFD